MKEVRLMEIWMKLKNKRRQQWTILKSKIQMLINKILQRERINLRQQTTSSVKRASTPKSQSSKQNSSKKYLRNQEQSNSNKTQTKPFKRPMRQSASLKQLVISSKSNRFQTSQRRSQWLRRRGSHSCHPMNPWWRRRRSHKHPIMCGMLRLT